MNRRKYLALLVSGAVALLFIAVLSVFAVRFALRYYKVTRDLATEQDRLNRLNQRRPFPNEENIERLEANRTVLAETLQTWLGDLAEGQYEPPEMEPARFPQELRRMSERLRQIAQSNSVKIPDQFAFGFDRYFKGELPRREEVRRLLIQVNAVEHVCRALFEGGIAEITKVERQMFDQQSAAAAGPAEGGGYAVLLGRPAPEAAPEAALGTEVGRDPDDLFTWERVTVEFATKETGLWQSINRLLSAPAFIVIHRMTVTNPTPRPEIKKTEGDGRSAPAELPRRLGPAASPAPLPEGRDLMGLSSEGAGGRVARPPSREERIVAGRDEVLQVRVEVAVFRFNRAASVGP